MIPKPGGGERPLGIPTIRDRVAQTATKIVLEPIFEADFEDGAYGYRPRRSAVDAVKETHRLMCRGYTDVVDADLSKYFDTMSGSSAIAGFRPHRTHRAALPQWALQKGPEAGRSLQPCLVDHRFREREGGQQLAVGRPGHAAFLAAFAERFAPPPDDAVLEHPQ